ncbi:geranylgeranyl diphosphate synthase, type I [Actinopolymorpha cephalotaxi]|uniref:Geranylgeranyl diphosphate synthase, type I n=1 Tax=Actinopolymorpha cephalotaxi TaxID=504797 RepID=A0A1I2YBA0_9ACTN|nr:geranylgeranyl diphosphate synthase, type I [Actinopolymorpha cephalotaxi]
MALARPDHTRIPYEQGQFGAVDDLPDAHTADAHTDAYPDDLADSSVAELAEEFPDRLTEEFDRAVDTYLRDLLAAEAEPWTEGLATRLTDRAGDRVSELLADLRGRLAGGKRLRPAFCGWGFVGVDGTPPDDTAVRAAAALELLHTFALVHDDVMDGSSSRRGIPALHTSLQARHTGLGWRGDPRRFGEGLAVLVGDLAFTLAHRIAAGLPDSAARTWHQMCTELVIGQHLDMLGSATGERDADYATSVATLKSGRYTVVRPLQLGAGLAGGSRSLAAAYAEYGNPLGVAFQLRDDLLGAFGDSAATGKPVGEDLREGRPTLLLAVAAERAGPAERRLLDRVGDPGLGDDEVAELTAVLRRTDADVEVEQQVKLAVDRALLALERAPVHPRAVPALRALAEEAAWRQR